MRLQARDVAAIERACGRSSAGITPVIRLNSVVLPAPFGPMIALSTPLRKIDVDVVDGNEAAEALGEALDGQHAAPWRISSSPRSAVGARRCRAAGVREQARPIVPGADQPRGANMTTRMIDGADRDQVVLPHVRRRSRGTGSAAPVPTSGPSSVPTPPTMAQTTASPDT